MPNIRGSEWLILILIVVILFGAKKLPEAARGLGRSLRIFKSEVTTKDDAEDVEPHGATAVEPQAITQVPMTPVATTPAVQAPAQPYAPTNGQPPAQAYVPPATVVQTAPAVVDSTSVQSVNERFYGEERSER